VAGVSARSYVPSWIIFSKSAATLPLFLPLAAMSGSSIVQATRCENRGAVQWFSQKVSRRRGCWEIVGLGLVMLQRGVADEDSHGRLKEAVFQRVKRFCFRQGPCSRSELKPAWQTPKHYCMHTVTARSQPWGLVVLFLALITRLKP
jgi:hypothetical protein